jgi:hypothetical protein
MSVNVFCESTDRLNQYTMELVTTLSEVRLSVYGEGFVSINWGDGTVISRLMVLSSKEDNNRTSIFSHTYSTNNTHTIIITGADVYTLFCFNAGLIDLKISNNPQLIELYASNNRLTSLNVSNNANLVVLDCAYNRLTSLDVSKNTKLLRLSCEGNRLSALNVRNNRELLMIDCRNNQLTRLDVSNNTELMHLACSYNQFNASSLNNLFRTLHINYVGSQKILRINNNPGYNDCNKNIALDKHWVIN